MWAWAWLWRARVTSGSAAISRSSSPAEVAAEPLLDRLGGNEEGEGQAAPGKPRPSLLVDRAVGVVHGDDGGLLGQGGPAFVRLDEGPPEARPASPLFKGRAGGVSKSASVVFGARDVVFAEAVVDEDGCKLGLRFPRPRFLPRRRCGKGGKSGQKDGQEGGRGCQKRGGTRSGGGAMGGV